MAWSMSLDVTHVVSAAESSSRIEETHKRLMFMKIITEASLTHYLTVSATVTSGQWLEIDMHEKWDQNVMQH